MYYSSYSTIYIQKKVRQAIFQLTEKQLLKMGQTRKSATRYI